MASETSGDALLNAEPTCEQLKHKLKDEVKAEPNEIDILNWMTRTTLEFIGQGGLSYQFGALDGMQNEYREASQKLS